MVIKSTFIIDGANFSNLDEFYIEVQNKLTKGLDWTIGNNLDAFNDVLRGGFEAYDYEEPIKLIWRNSEKSKRDFSKAHPMHEGKSMFDIMVEIVKSHEHIEFSLE